MLFCWHSWNKKKLNHTSCSLVSYSQVNNNPEIEQFTMLKSLGDGSNFKRDINSLIFEQNETIFVNIYPSILPKIIKDKKFFEFETKLQESLFDLQNFLFEYPLKKYHEIIFTFPINKGKAHWVEGTLKINQKGKVQAKINDPNGKKNSGILNIKYAELKQIIENNLIGKKLSSALKLENQAVNYISENIMRYIEGCYTGVPL